MNNKNIQNNFHLLQTEIAKLVIQTLNKCKQMVTISIFTKLMQHLLKHKRCSHLKGHDRKQMLPLVYQKHEFADTFFFYSLAFTWSKNGRSFYNVTYHQHVKLRLSLYLILQSSPLLQLK